MRPRLGSWGYAAWRVEVSEGRCKLPVCRRTADEKASLVVGQNQCSPSIPELAFTGAFGLKGRLSCPCALGRRAARHYPMSGVCESAFVHAFRGNSLFLTRADPPLLRDHRIAGDSSRNKHSARTRSGPARIASMCTARAGSRSPFDSHQSKDSSLSWNSASGSLLNTFAMMDCAGMRMFR